MQKFIDVFMTVVVLCAGGFVGAALLGVHFPNSINDAAEALIRRWP
jgi:hypothetical protein